MVIIIKNNKIWNMYKILFFFNKYFPWHAVQNNKTYFIIALISWLIQQEKHGTYNTNYYFRQKVWTKNQFIFECLFEIN